MNDTDQLAMTLAEPPQTQAITVAPQVTPAQARIESVARALDSAYNNASTLKLTEDEATRLSADFPDEAFSLGAGGDQNLVYIEHAYLRQRLNQVLGIGAAVPMRRREWAEEFQYTKDGRQKTGVRVYVDLALIVRGCLVGEAIGDAVYYPDNAKQNYSDALESAKSNAFRRCCKEFGVGLQAWMKGWCEGWKIRQRGKPANVTSMPAPTNPTPKPTKTYDLKPTEKPQAKAEDVAPKPTGATEKTRAWMLGNIQNIPHVGEYAHSMGFGDDINDWPLANVPTTKQGLAELIKEIENFAAKLNSQEPEASFDEMPEDLANCVITVPRAGSKRVEYLQNPDTIGSLYAAVKDGDSKARVRLFGLAREWAPQDWVGKDGQKRPPSQDDLNTRAALDRFLEWHEKKGEPTE